MQVVGVIHQLGRYPVKSMRGEWLDTASLTLQGISEDRRYAFVQAASRSAFPWLTARELPEMLFYQPRVEGADAPQVTGIAELHFSSVQSLGDDFYNSAEGQAEIRADVSRFTEGATTLCVRERVVSGSDAAADVCGKRPTQY